MIDNWNYTEDDAGVAQYIKDQMQLPLTSLREEYRRGADFSLNGNQVGAAAVMPAHPCSQYSRWRDFAFTGDDYGAPVKAESFGGKILITVRGAPRTIVDAFGQGIGDYSFGKFCFKSLRSCRIFPRA